MKAVRVIEVMCEAGRASIEALHDGARAMFAREGLRA